MNSYMLVVSCLFLWIACKKSTNDGTTGPQTATRDSLFTEHFRRTKGWIAGDDGYSIRLTDGRTLWLWGDSYIDNYDAATRTIPCLFQVNNAGLLQNATNPADMATLLGAGKPASYFLHPGGWPTYWFWPGSGYQQGNTVYCFLDNIKTTGANGSFGFTSGGPNYVATIQFPAMTVQGYKQLPAQNGINFGAGFVPHPDGFMYVYGYKGDGFVGSKMYVARIKPDDPITSWQYYDGANWITDPTKAAPIASDGTSSFASGFKVGNKFALLSSEFSLGCTGKEIYAFTADQPQGPYSSRKLIYTIPEKAGDKYPFFYFAIGHPEFIDNQGLLVTYSVNGFLQCGPEVCINNRRDPDTYRPKAFRVPLSVLGAQ
ncbi:hypothetical protein IC229_31130 [Spirosoma sp. BT702]|uniref:DUF4185 domain-containing protein n=1 Tax=Spirosoma profusum TaxID=2771354 RepID=A0A927AVD1_9BACT|nr:hypothetical protein [Spirosoma profusum]MBD2705118.1 hypothetical protein [Spirosoma profusum]